MAIVMEQRVKKRGVAEAMIVGGLPDAVLVSKKKIELDLVTLS